jgi:Tol biopolymer transport system component
MRSCLVILGVFGSVLGCGHHAGGGGGTGGDAGYSALVIQPATATVAVSIDATATQAYTVLATTGSGTVDVTASCPLTVDPTFGTIASGVMTVLPKGGTTAVTASCEGVTATSSLTVDLGGTIVTGSDTPPDAPQLFGSATLGSDAALAPTIQYPVNNAVAPLNLPPMEMQWATGSNDLFHISLTSTDASVDVYTSDPQATLSAAEWNAIVNTAVGQNLTITVEGLVQAMPATKYASVPVSLALSSDTIDTSAIYYWASSQGDIMSQTFGQTSAPTVVDGNCTACHSLSRAGSRIGYCRCVGGNCGDEYVGFLRYDVGSNTWNEAVNADNETIPGTYTTFAPVGNPFPDDSHAIALVTSTTGTLSLYDPDTGSAVPSNLAQIAVPGRSALMPDWSADGNTVVFASPATTGQSVDVSNSSIATMSYSYATGSHVFGTPTMLVPAPITLNGQSYDNLFFPSFSPDGKWVIFDAATAPWRNFTDEHIPGQRLAMVPAAGGAPFDLTALDGGSGSLDTTWPHWAPGNTTDYYWIVFSSERDYGHEVTAANTNPNCVENGVKQCKQIWIGAISKAALASGSGDPSFEPVWLPGQATTADNISPYWTIPAGIE